MLRLIFDSVKLISIDNERYDFTVCVKVQEKLKKRHSTLICRQKTQSFRYLKGFKDGDRTFKYLISIHFRECQCIQLISIHCREYQFIHITLFIAFVYCGHPFFCPT